MTQKTLVRVLVFLLGWLKDVKFDEI